MFNIIIGVFNLLYHIKKKVDVYMMNTYSSFTRKKMSESLHSKIQLFQLM